MYDIDKIDVERYSKLGVSVQYSFPWFFENIRHQTSVVEYTIQKWWATRIDLIDKKVNILSSGVGFFSVPFAYEKGAKQIVSYDMDPTTHDLAWILNKYYTPVFAHKQNNIIFDNDELDKSADVWINTSCEHSYPMKKVIPSNKICVLSGNNCTKRGHINLIDSVDELIEQNGLKDILFTDEMEFEFEDDRGKQNYTQFFVTGIKE